MARSLSPWFDFGSGQDGSGWEEFVSDFESFCENASITEGERGKVLLSHVDQATAGVVQALSDGSDSIQALQKKLQSFFSSAEGSQIRDIVFRSARQQEKERLSDFVSRLQVLAQGCFFKEKDKEVLLQSILGCSSEEIRQRALWNDQLELRDLVAMETVSNRSNRLPLRLHSSQRDEGRAAGGDQQDATGDDVTVTGKSTSMTDKSSDIIKAGASADRPYTDRSVKTGVRRCNKSCQTDERSVFRVPEKEESWKEGSQVSQNGFLLVGGTPVSFSISFNSAAGVETIGEERFQTLLSKTSPGAGKRGWKSERKRERTNRQERNRSKKRNSRGQWQSASVREPDQEEVQESRWPSKPRSSHRGLGARQTSGVAGDRDDGTSVDRSQDEEGRQNSEEQQQSTLRGDDNDTVSSIAEMFEGWEGGEGNEDPDDKTTQAGESSLQSSDDRQTETPASNADNWEDDPHRASGHSSQGKWTRQSDKSDQSWFRQRHHHRNALPWNYFDERENLILFFGKQSPFSQHHPCRFWMEGREYNCTEQYMMYMKAVIAGDTETGEAILSLNNPARQKRLGSEVRGLDRLLWDRLCEDIVFRANWAKFSQNPHLREALLETRPKVLVEASPSDSQWGVGLGKDDPKAWCLKTWRGANRLGYILMQVREALAAETMQMNYPLTSADQAYLQSAKQEWAHQSEGQWTEQSGQQQGTLADQEQPLEMAGEDYQGTGHPEEQWEDEADTTQVTQESDDAAWKHADQGLDEEMDASDQQRSGQPEEQGEEQPDATIPTQPFSVTE